MVTSAGDNDKTICQQFIFKSLESLHMNLITWKKDIPESWLQL